MDLYLHHLLADHTHKPIFQITIQSYIGLSSFMHFVCVYMCVCIYTYIYIHTVKLVFTTKRCLPDSLLVDFAPLLCLCVDYCGAEANVEDCIWRWHVCGRHTRCDLQFTCSQTQLRICTNCRFQSTEFMKLCWFRFWLECFGCKMRITLEVIKDRNSWKVNKFY